MSAPLRIATRGSALARTQADTVGAALAELAGRTYELVIVTTRGDLDPAPLQRIGGTGVFVAAVREAVLAGAADVAVHSLKDLPTAPVAGLSLAAVPVRQDPRDALCARDGLGLADLPEGATVGTGSPRRAAQLRALRPDLEIVALRGNVDTRLAAVAAGDLDAVVLARAGLARLDRLAAVTETLDPLLMLPAPGQGALAVECRAGDPVDAAEASLHAALRGYDDPATRAAVTAERCLLAALEAGCTAPVGAYADITGDLAAAGDPAGMEQPEMYLRAAVVADDGSSGCRLSITGPAADAEELGRRLAADLLADGAADLMGERVP
jgi:hydroxymethylbilane synthase